MTGKREDELQPTDGCRLDPAAIAALYVQHGDELRRLLVGILRNVESANDVLQITFAKAVEVGHTAREDTLKGWLFRIAYHEALALRRRQAVHDKATREIILKLPCPWDLPEANLARMETIARVRQAMEKLSAQQREVVSLRIFEQKKFVEIANELQVPLGTVLTRMRSALERLRKHLGNE